MLKQGYNNLWPTPVFVGEMTNKQLMVEMIEELLLLSGDISNGISDKNSILNTNNLTINKFKNEIVVPVFDQYLKDVFDVSLKDYPKFKMNAWLTGQSDGYGMPIHNHAGSEVSAVFYFISEEKSAGGQLILVDPRVNSNRGYDLNFRKFFNNVEYAPLGGQYIIFPSFLYHWVSYYHSKLRLAMPVDIFIGPHLSLLK